MRHIIKRDNYNFSFNRLVPPVLEINSGDIVVFETIDAHNRTVPDGTDVVFPDLDFKYCNPITGPVGIRNSEPGDILKIQVKKINLASKGFVPARKNMGSVKGLTQKNIARNINVRDGLLYFSDKIIIPARPMIGTIGVAPGEGEIHSNFPGIHGGNMDNNDIKMGSILYLPVFVKGALLSVGDVHATMGDGELTSGGVDIDAEVTLKVEIIKNSRINRPIIETGNSYVTTSNSPDFYKANKVVTLEMINLLRKGLGVTEIEAYWLISMYGDLKISQAADCKIDLTLRLSFPKFKKYLKWKKIF